MIQTVYIENPFDPIHSKRSENNIYLGMNVLHYIDQDKQTSYYDIYIDGAKVSDPKNTIPLDNAQIVVLPHVAGGDGMDFLGMIASIALMAFATAITGPAGLGAAWGLNATWSVVAAGAVMFLGGRVINALFPQQAATTTLDDHRVDNQKTQTYGWDLPSVSTVEGGIVGKTYGTCIPQPQLLQEHVETAADGKQYLNLLYCGGEGPVDSISNLRIDTTPIDCFSNVQIETRLGTNDQEPISFFSATPTDQSIGLMLDTNKPLIRSTDSTWCDSLEVTVEWNNGLYVLNNDGSYGSASVSFTIEYRKTDSKDKSWINVGDYSVSNATADGFRKSYKWDVKEAARYDVRVTLTNKPSGSRSMALTSWGLLTSYNNQKFSYPNKVLVGLRILATNQLSGGVPSINWRQTRKYVYVYDPDAKAYAAKPATNPIWAAYDILHDCQLIRNINTGKDEYIVGGCKHEHLDKYFDNWKAAAAYADEQIINHDGEKESRYEFDAFYDVEAKRYNAAVKAAAVGHAAIIVEGTNYNIIADKPANISQVFGEGRTTVSSVNGSFTSRDERARAIEVTYNDEDNDFKNSQFTVRSALFGIEGKQDNTAQLTLFGVRRRSQAYREAVTALATNERQLQFLELKTDINGLVAEYGGVVGYSHTISQIGIASGRIVGATKTTIQLDKEVTLSKDKTYEIYISLQDDSLLKKSVVGIEGKTNTLTLADPFDTLPNKYDPYNFGESGKAVKPFRIVGAERDGDLKVTLKLAEYDEAVYATELDYSNYPITDYTASSDSQDVIKEITLSSRCSTRSDGSIDYSIIAEWSIINSSARPDSYEITLDDGNTKKVYSSTNTGYTFSGLDSNIKYTVSIKCCYSNGIKIGSHQRNIVIPQKNAAPDSVTGLTATVKEKLIHVSWTGAEAPDLQGYNIYWGSIGSALSACQLFGQIAATVCDIPFTDAKNYVVYVESVDKSGNKSAAVSAAVTMAAPDSVTNLTVKQQNRKYICSWNEVADADFYEIRTDINAGAAAGMLAQTTATSAEIALTTRSGRIYVYSHNKAGVYSQIPTYIDYNFDTPAPPKITEINVSSVLSVLTISVPIPTNCVGFKVHVVGSSVTNYDKVVYSTADYIDISLQPDIYTITVAYYDSIGDGTYSDSVTATVKVEIDASTVHITSQTVFDDNVITSKMLQAGAVTADKLAAGAIHADTLDAISAKIGTLRTATTGARMEIHDNLIMIYDESNNLRVKMGVW